MTSQAAEQRKAGPRANGCEVCAQIGIRLSSYEPLPRQSSDAPRVSAALSQRPRGRTPSQPAAGGAVAVAPSQGPRSSSQDSGARTRSGSQDVARFPGVQGLAGWAVLWAFGPDDHLARQQ
jgi:nucleoid-associated protein YgaU